MDDDEPAWTEIRNDAREGATIWDWYCPYAGHDAEIIRSEPGGWRNGYPVLRILEARTAAPSSLPI